MTDFSKEQLIAYLQDELTLLREVSAKLPRTNALKMDIVIHEVALAALTSAPVVPDEMTEQVARMAVGFNRYLAAGYTDGWNACRAAMIATAPGKEG